MQLFNKSYLKWKIYNDRDLLFKLNLNNIYKLPEINQIVCKQNIAKSNDIFNNVSLNILLFDEYPLFLKINKKINNKKKNNILVNKIILSKLKFFFFFLRFKYEESYLSIKDKIKKINKETNTVTFYINLNIFDEFLFLYDKYPVLSDILVTLKFVNCKKMEEKQLLLDNILKL